MESVNPFLDNIEKYKDIQEHINDYQHQIEAIKRDLATKVNMLVESRANHKKAMELQAKELLKMCTHFNAEGQPAIDKTHSGILSQVNDKLISYSYCGLCGEKFKTGESDITPVLKQKMINISIDNLFDDEDEFVDTVEFNPEFDNQKFLDITDEFADTVEFNPEFDNQKFLDITDDYFKIHL
jgi:hypothetical protein